MTAPIDYDAAPPKQPIWSANMSDIEEAVWKFWARRGEFRRLSSSYTWNTDGHVHHKERICTTTSNRLTHRKATPHAKS